MPTTRIIINTTNTTRRSFTARDTNGVSDSQFYSTFNTGDKLQFTATTNLTWITGITNQTPNGNSKSYYVHIDQIGAIRLYDTLAAALTGSTTDAVPLEANNNVNMQVQVSYVDTTYNILAQVTSYELSTTKESIDATALSEEFRSHYSGLMSGSGRLECIWDYTNIGLGANSESVNYLLQLVTRTQVGGEFGARLYLKTDQYNPTKNNVTSNDSLYYEISAVITNAAVAFQPNTIVEATIEFITTGQIKLQIDTSPLVIIQLPGAAGGNLVNETQRRIAGDPQGV